MKIHIDKKQGNKSRALNDEPSLENAGQEGKFQHIDNRPEAAIQRKLHEIANNSPRVKQLNAYQQMANNSAQNKEQASIHNALSHFSNNICQ